MDAAQFYAPRAARVRTGSRLERDSCQKHGASRPLPTYVNYLAPNPHTVSEIDPMVPMRNAASLIHREILRARFWGDLHHAASAPGELFPRASRIPLP